LSYTRKLGSALIWIISPSHIPATMYERFPYTTGQTVS